MKSAIFFPLPPLFLYSAWSDMVPNILLKNTAFFSLLNIHSWDKLKLLHIGTIWGLTGIIYSGTLLCGFLFSTKNVCTSLPQCSYVYWMRFHRMYYSVSMCNFMQKYLLVNFIKKHRFTEDIFICFCDRRWIHISIIKHNSWIKQISVMVYVFLILSNFLIFFMILLHKI